jgi:predicted AlkP superfamily pyrophosphatase or phosphodiesterase
MQLPDYHGGSIVNLMSSLIAGRGGQPSDYATLRDLGAEEVAAHRNVVLLVIDGMGHDYLLRHRPKGTLRSRLRTRITSVFPSTTASAITSFLTGEAPQQHGLTGWHMYLRELGAVLAVLPGRPRFGGADYREAGVHVRGLFGHVPVFDRLSATSHVVSPAHIAHSEFNLAHLGRAELHGYQNLHGLLNSIVSAVRSDKEPKFVYAYWPELDSLGHAYGIGSKRTIAHLSEIDAAFEQLLDQLAGSDTLLLVTADHGQIDTTAGQRIFLEDHPAMQEMLWLPLCGEPRVAYCYLKPGQTEAFERYVQDELSHAMDAYPSEELIHREIFGLGRPHGRLRERLGDYTLVLKGDYVIRDRLAGEQPFEQVGVHGGPSAAEMFVPLIVANC